MTTDTPIMLPFVRFEIDGSLCQRNRRIHLLYTYTNYRAPSVSSKQQKADIFSMSAVVAALESATRRSPNGRDK
jgi:hypothetical protein